MHRLILLIPASALLIAGILPAQEKEDPAPATQRIVAPAPQPAQPAVQVVAVPDPPVENLKDIEAQIAAFLPALEQLGARQRAGRRGGLQLPAAPPIARIKIHQGFIIEAISDEVEGKSDDRAADPAEVKAPKVRVRLALETFDQWVFGGRQAAPSLVKEKDLQSRLQEAVRERVLDVDRFCKLSVSQRRKLELAGQGDVHAVISQYDELRRDFERVQDDLAKSFAVLELARPLRALIRSRSLGPESLFDKVLRSTLTADQAAEYDRQRTAPVKTK